MSMWSTWHTLPQPLLIRRFIFMTMTGSPDLPVSSYILPYIVNKNY